MQPCNPNCTIQFLPYLCLIITTSNSIAMREDRIKRREERRRRRALRRNKQQKGARTQHVKALEQVLPDSLKPYTDYIWLNYFNNNM